MTDFRPLFPNSDDLGNPVVTRNYKIISNDGYRKCGLKFVATAGDTTFYDRLLTEAVQLRGGWTWIGDTAVWGDEMYMSVIDKDDVLGLFALYGLTVGVDVLELTRYVKSFTVPPGGIPVPGYQVDPGTYSGLVAGLYLRTAYISEGAEDVNVILHYDWYEIGAP